MAPEDVRREAAQVLGEVYAKPVDEGDFYLRRLAKADLPDNLRSAISGGVDFDRLQLGST